MTVEIASKSIWNNGTSWHLPDGTSHREDGPSLEWYDGTTFYKKYGKFHRLDGPAAIFSDGAEDWYINGCYIDGKIYCKWLQDIGIDLNNLSDDDITMIMIKWGDYGKNTN